MKRVLIGGFLSLIGTIWSLAVIGFFADGDLVSKWSTPPGRFFTTVIETGMMIPMIIGIAIFLVGILIIGVEYFKKDK